MHLSTFAFYGMIEAIAFLTILCVFLLLFLRRQKAKTLAIQSTLEKLIVKYKTLNAKHIKSQTKPSKSQTYQQQISDQLTITRQYHEGLDPGQDISLDLNPNSPIERQTAAIRYAMLVAEKEALNASTDGKPNWRFLQSKFKQLVQFYIDLNKQSCPDNDPSNGHEGMANLQQQLDEAQATLSAKNTECKRFELDLSTTQKRLNNLEKFKQLFFEMEDKWRAAKSEADSYYQQLQGLRDQLNEPENFDTLLTNYHNVYRDFELSLNAMSERHNGSNNEEDDGFIVLDADRSNAIEEDLGNHSQNENKQGQDIDITTLPALEELNKLRSLTADQHRLISALQKQLHDAASAEQKDALIENLQQELDKQIRFVQESEACIQLLENELTGATTRLKELEAALADAEKGLRDIPEMKNTIRQFAQESKSLLSTVSELEHLNGQLKANQIDDDDLGDKDELVEKMQEQLSALQGKYADLEERYLEARMSG